MDLKKFLMTDAGWGMAGWLDSMGVPLLMASSLALMFEGAEKSSMDRKLTF